MLTVISSLDFELETKDSRLLEDGKILKGKGPRCYYCMEKHLLLVRDNLGMGGDTPYYLQSFMPVNWLRLEFKDTSHRGTMPSHFVFYVYFRKGD